MRKRRSSVTRWRVDGGAFGARLIHFAVMHGEALSLKEDSQARFVLEFLVLCRFLLTMLGVRSRVAKSYLAGIHEEFISFNPEYEDLLEARLEHYFKASLEVPPGSNLAQWLVDDWAKRVEVPTNVAPWAYGVLLEASLLFMELIGLAPTAVGICRPRTRKD